LEYILQLWGARNKEQHLRLSYMGPFEWPCPWQDACDAFDIRPQTFSEMVAAVGWHAKNLLRP